jgi:hypothetical protein
MIPVGTEVWWWYQPRGGFGATSPQRATVVGYTTKRVRLRVPVPGEDKHDDVLVRPTSITPIGDK